MKFHYIVKFFIFSVIFGYFGKLIHSVLFWYKIYMFIISCVISLIFPVWESTVCACFHIKLLIFLWMCSFHVHYDVTEQELSFLIIATSPRYVMQKVWIQVLWILQYVGYFSSEEILQCLSKNNPIKKQIDAKIQVTLKNAPAGKREEKMLFHKTNLQNNNLNVFSINFAIWIMI